LFQGVQLLDIETGRARRHDYGDHAVAEEHILVPKPGKTGERDAWLLGTTFDSRRQATVLNVLDAAHVEDGPIAQAVLPYTLPLGLHGNFTAA
jgi:carotenoid cleavage dioxygenase